MLTINKLFPEFSLPSSLRNGEFGSFATKYDKYGNYLISSSNEEIKGRWLVLFAYARDFTDICPTELQAFDEVRARIQGELKAELAAFSTDSQFSHVAWRESDARIRVLGYPLLADSSHALSTALGILDANQGTCLRATFIVDDRGLVRHVSVNDEKVGRNANEIVRVLSRLQTGQHCAACTLGDDVGEPVDLISIAE